MVAVAVALRVVIATLICGVSLAFGSAGTAWAHGTHTPPEEPHPPVASAHHGPYSVLHQGLNPGPFSVLRPAR